MVDGWVAAMARGRVYTDGECVVNNVVNTYVVNDDSNTYMVNNVVKTIFLFPGTHTHTPIAQPTNRAATAG